MKKIKQVISTCCFGILLTACGGSDSSGGNSTADSGSTNNPGGPVVAQRLQQAGADDLLTKIKQVLLAQYGELNVGGGIPELATDDSAQAAAPEAYSTNVQEAGVDEADRLKTDGEHLYVASVEQAKVMVFTANEQPTKLADLELDTGDDNVSLNGLYLQDERLVALASPYQFGIYPLAADIMPYFPTKTETRVFSIDVAQPSQSQQLSTLKLEGELVSSRMIGSRLYLATRHTPTLEGLIYPNTEAEAAANRDKINAAILEDFLPDYAVNGVDQGELFGATDCFTTSYNNDLHTVSIVSLLSVDTNQATPEPKGQCFLGDIETLYASTSAIYLATTSYNYDIDSNGWAIYTGDMNTDIHRFGLDNGEVSYSGSGRVNGHLGWYQDLKPFRMSEYEDTLRVITYTGDSPDGEASPAHLYNLQANSNGDLQVIGELPNAQRPEPLGKLGEQIYATRFVGDRGYLVTYRLTDPLYILDLSNPSDPLIAGELEIDGYSDYLHPVGENLLLGIGKDAVVGESGGPEVFTAVAGSEAIFSLRADIAARTPAPEVGAWYQGVKVSLIDVSNPAQPFEKQKLIFGKRGSETAVAQAHHAFTSLLQGNTMQVAIPLSRHETVNNNFVDDGYNPDLPQFYYDWTQDELVRLEIDVANGIIMEKPSIISKRASENNDEYPYSNWWQEDRSVLINGQVFYVHGDEVINAAW